MSVDYETVKKVAMALADVVDSSTLRGMAFKAGGKLLACKAIHRSAEPDSLMVRVDSASRDRLIAADPQTYYLTAHYRVNSSVLVRMKAIDRKALQALFVIAWQFVTAPSPAGRKVAKRRKAGSVFRHL